VAISPKAIRIGSASASPGIAAAMQRAAATADALIRLTSMFIFFPPNNRVPQPNLKPILH
jgi:hypothetical protein